MSIENISSVEIDDDKILLLILEAEGKPDFQYVYRAAKGVYWDSAKNGFKIDLKGDEDYGKWFKHLLDVIETEIGLQLRPGDNLAWTNVPFFVQQDLLKNWV